MFRRFKITIKENRRWALGLLATLIFCVGWFGGWWYTIHHAYRGKIIRSGAHEYINPILSCEIADQNAFYELKPIKDSLQKLVNQKISDGEVSDISVYLRTLNSGRWFGINEEKVFAPASLLKVAIMMAYYKEAESNPEILSQKLVYNPSSRSVPLDVTDHPEALQPGETYRIDKLIEKMIVESNNPALGLLVDNALPNAIKEVFDDLNLPLANSLREEGLDVMSTKTYSLVFRVLYGASYLNQEMSNKTLELLTKTTFTEGLRLGVPANVAVAHKFGARTAIPYEGALKGVHAKELHDCGVVYYPKHPYLLCVMTRGADFDKLASAVADISRLTYNNIDGFFKKNP